MKSPTNPIVIWAHRTLLIGIQFFYSRYQAKHCSLICPIRQCIYNFYVPGNNGSIVGNDYAGVVVSVGPNVTRYQPGDRVAGFVFGNLNKFPDTGAFSEYVLGEADISLKIPDSLSFEDAATLGTAVTTIGQSLYQSLNLPFPTEPAKDSPPILIYGGSSAMGSLAIQFAKLSGYKVVTTASPKNFDFVKAMGAEEVIDYVRPILKL